MIGRDTRLDPPEDPRELAAEAAGIDLDEYDEYEERWSALEDRYMDEVYGQ